MLNSILEEDQENASTFGDDAFLVANEFIQQKQLGKTTAPTANNNNTETNDDKKQKVSLKKE